MLQRLLMWLFKDLIGAWNAAWRMHRSDLANVFSRFNDLEHQLRARRPKAYVTLRGHYLVGNKEVLHAWTLPAEAGEGDLVTVRFNPYSPFKTERVDVLGPATIVDVRVGNLVMGSPGFEAPASLEFSETVLPGSLVAVTVKGMP